MKVEREQLLAAWREVQAAAVAEEIRETEGFLAWHWDTAAAEARLVDLRAQLAVLRA